MTIYVFHLAPPHRSVQMITRLTRSTRLASARARTWVADVDDMAKLAHMATLVPPCVYLWCPPHCVEHRATTTHTHAAQACAGTARWFGACGSRTTSPRGIAYDGALSKEPSGFGRRWRSPGCGLPIRRQHIVRCSCAARGLLEGASSAHMGSSKIISTFQPNARCGD